MQVKFLNEYSQLSRSLFPSRIEAGQAKSLGALAEASTTSAFKQLDEVSSDDLRTLEQYLENDAAEDAVSQTPISAKDQALADDLSVRARYSPLPALIPGEMERLSGVLNPGSETISNEGSIAAPEILSAKRVTIRSASTQDLKDFVGGLVGDAARRMQLDPDLGLAIIQTESSFRPRAISSDGHASKGLFQLLDSTGKELASTHFPDREYDPFDPQLNVELGMRHLKHLFDVFKEDTKLTDSLVTSGAANSSSREKLAVAAFNAGEGRVAWAQMQAAKQGLDASSFENIKEYLPASTRTYVDKVTAAKERVSSM
jgi:soluble lytic murein transglycosylase-like protein